jgi:hypothetical protein
MPSTQSESVQQRAYRVRQFCDAFNVCKTTVYARINDGTLKTRKIGKVRIILVPTEEAAIIS